MRLCGILRILTVLVVLAPAGAGGENLVMPEDLVKFAADRNCAQVSNFFQNRLGKVNPPYVYGYGDHTDEENSVVFWCADTSGKGKPFRLMFKFKTPYSDPDDCPDVIEFGIPRGLSIERNMKGLTLDGFFYVSDPKQKLPKGVRMDENAVRNEYGGAGEIFYCYEGNWTMVQLD